MKERHLFTLLSVEAAACVLFCILQRSLSGLFSTLIAFPFEQIGADTVFSTLLPATVMVFLNHVTSFSAS